MWLLLINMLGFRTELTENCMNRSSTVWSSRDILADIFLYPHLVSAILLNKLQQLWCRVVWDCGWFYCEETMSFYQTLYASFMQMTMVNYCSRSWYVFYQGHQLGHTIFWTIRHSHFSLLMEPVYWAGRMVCEVNREHSSSHKGSKGTTSS
jgi:hypothetical protein